LWRAKPLRVADGIGDGADWASGDVEAKLGPGGDSLPVRAHVFPCSVDSNALFVNPNSLLALAVMRDSREAPQLPGLVAVVRRRPIGAAVF
jgi:hypothetical protein